MQVKRFTALAFCGFSLGASAGSALAAPIQIAFLWHMHQPIYYPYESPVVTDAFSRFSFSVVDIHNQRLGPYRAWPADAINAAASLPYAGAQVSFSGSLIENLGALAAAGVNGGQWTNWDQWYDAAQSNLTILGNRRLEMIGFGYHHPLMPLLDERDIRMQIKLHKHAAAQTWTGGASYSHGIFPPETAFSTRIIPALVAEGIEWAMVDNIHFDRACVNYPHTNASSIYPPNKADQINPDPAASGGAWVQLQNLWAPSRVSAPFGYRPHRIQHVNPDTGAITAMTAVPAARYEGNEDGRGGYGAFLYDAVMDALLPYNNDPTKPLLVLLHHDGDNYGGGTDSYYHHNWNNMVSWVSGDPDYDVTTIEDYLDRFPVQANDVIHVENGSWAGADAGDPEFKKWLGDPNAQGWSPDRNSWAVLTAAKNRVFHADDLAPYASIANVRSGVGTATEKAWHWLLVSEASDYWYWDGTQIWDSNVTVGSNQAVVFANQVINANPGVDTTKPNIFLPQRNPYNPGGLEWNPTPEPSDFEVWTYAYDVSGLTSVTLKWRADVDGVNPIASTQNETYAGGAEVGAWNSIAMTSSDVAPQNGVIAPTYRALRYGAFINGQNNVLIDYYVEAVDGHGNIARSDIQHVWVGTNTTTGGGDGGVTITPDPAQAGELVTIDYDPTGGPLSGAATVKLHYGFNQWNPVISPDPTMTWIPVDGVWRSVVSVPTTADQLDVVFNNGAGTWDNNNGADWHFTVEGADPAPGFVMDGVRDASSIAIASNGGLTLWADLQGTTLYVATNDAGEGNDHFIYLANPPGSLRAANWDKAGQIANWSAFLADENNNDYESWFDAAPGAQAATGPNGGVLEGTIDLVSEFGSMPTEVYLAVGVYGNNDGGALVFGSQVPASVNNNGNIDASEYVLLDLSIFAPPTECDGDVNGDGDTNVADFNILASHFGQTVAPNTSGDLTGDGQVNVADFNILAGDFGCGSP